MRQALSSPGPFLYGVASILLITPLMGLAALAVDIKPKEFPMGLAVFCCMPTSLSTCVTLTMAAGANSVRPYILHNSQHKINCSIDISRACECVLCVSRITSTSSSPPLRRYPS